MAGAICDIDRAGHLPIHTRRSRGTVFGRAQTALVDFIAAGHIIAGDSRTGVLRSVSILAQQRLPCG